MQLIVFFGAIILLNLAFAKKISSIKSIVYVSGGISIVASICFQLLGYFVMSYLDPFILIATSIQIVAAFMIGFIVNFILLKLFRSGERQGQP